MLSSMDMMANMRKPLETIANLLCQPENFSCPGTVAWDTKTTPFSGKPSLLVLTATFRDPHSLFELNNNTFKSFLSLYRQKFLQSLLFKKNVFI